MALAWHPSHGPDGEPRGWSVDLDEKEDADQERQVLGRPWGEGWGEGDLEEGHGSRPQGGGQGSGQVEARWPRPWIILIEAWGKAMLGAEATCMSRKEEQEGRDKTGVWDLIHDPESIDCSHSRAYKDSPPIPFILIEHLLYIGGSTLLPEASGLKATPQALPTEESTNLQTGVTNSLDSPYEEISFQRHLKVGPRESNHTRSAMCSEAVSLGKSRVFYSLSHSGSNPCFRQYGCCAWLPTACWELRCQVRKPLMGSILHSYVHSLITSFPIPKEEGWQRRKVQMTMCLVDPITYIRPKGVKGGHTSRSRVESRPKELRSARKNSFPLLPQVFPCPTYLGYYQ